MTKIELIEKFKDLPDDTVIDSIKLQEYMDMIEQHEAQKYMLLEKYMDLQESMNLQEYMEIQRKKIYTNRSDTSNKS